MSWKELIKWRIRLLIQSFVPKKVVERWKEEMLEKIEKKNEPYRINPKDLRL